MLSFRVEKENVWRDFLFQRDYPKSSTGETETSYDLEIKKDSHTKLKEIKRELYTCAKDVTRKSNRMKTDWSLYFGNNALTNGLRNGNCIVTFNV